MAVKNGAVTPTIPPPLQHSYSMTAHFLPALLLSPTLRPSSPLSPSTSLLSFFSCLYFTLSHCFFWGGWASPKKELKFTQASVCWRGFAPYGNGCFEKRRWGRVGGKVGVLNARLQPKVVVLQSRAHIWSARKAKHTHMHGCMELHYMTIK